MLSPPSSPVDMTTLTSPVISIEEPIGPLGSGASDLYPLHLGPVNLLPYLPIIAPAAAAGDRHIPPPVGVAAPPSPFPIPAPPTRTSTSAAGLRSGESQTSIIPAGVRPSPFS